MLGLFACCVALGVCVCVCVCVCLFTVDQHVSNEPLSLSTLDRTPIFTGVCKKKKEEEEKKQNPPKNLLFCRPELEFRGEFFAAQFETITKPFTDLSRLCRRTDLSPYMFLPRGWLTERHSIPHNV